MKGSAGERLTSILTPGTQIEKMGDQNMNKTLNNNLEYI
jgi:hypothetical protein